MNPFWHFALDTDIAEILVKLLIVTGFVNRVFMGRLGYGHSVCLTGAVSVDSDWRGGHVAGLGI